jgi:hypothetical protein
MSDPYVNWHACAHGLSADHVQLRRDERHGALWLELNDGVSIRIQVGPHATEDAGRFAAELDRDREGLRRLAAVAELAALEVDRIVNGDGR